MERLVGRLQLGEFVVNALLYLVSSLRDSGDYGFVLDGFGVYSPRVVKELRNGGKQKLLEELRDAGRIVKELCKGLDGLDCVYAIIYAARLHFIATKLYPPVDDPVEYAVLRYPGMDRATAERVLMRLRRLGLV